MISRNLKGLWDLLQSELALRYMKRHQQEHIRRYPQLCCIAFDHIGIHVNVQGRFDKEKLEFITSRFRTWLEGRTVCDVGANIGNHALAFAEHAGRVVAFEPHPFTFRLLELNSHHASNLTVLNLGASDAEGVVRAVTPPDNFGGSAISTAAVSGAHIFDFKVVRLDTLPDLAGEDIGFVKIDVEGHEPQALRGAEALLRKHKPMILLEQNRDAISGGTSESLELLRAFGYSHFYSLDTGLPWRTGNGLPKPARQIVRLFEAAFRGMPTMAAAATPVHRLEEGRDYDALLASPEALSFT